ncbi:hypothetical protein BDP27DRAFT_1365648 [Rhodocollybia butyracea]|uniref:Uncharacterized protein n=1 Tax=Rhodocollybia butyracea TaxID=206335 RepID=A0A9P5U594_9AGAR|nr:hypothetical protein BDP27DRAFT_1365648 [Rhodocollybia butyracea]
MEAFNWEAFYAQPVSPSSSQLANASSTSIPIADSILLTPPTTNDPQDSINLISPLISQQPYIHDYGSVSTTFGLNGVLDSNLYSGVPFHPPDTVFLSTDSISFYVHSDIILSISNNNFRSLLPTPLSRSILTGLNALEGHFRPPGSHIINTIRVPELSEILNLILHIIYNTSCASQPTLTELSTAIGQLPLYGVHPRSHINADSQMYALLIARAPFAPLDVYALAAKHDLRDLAVATSPHLLSLRLPTITEDIAQEIGPNYLRKLFFLHGKYAKCMILMLVLGADRRSHEKILLHPPKSHTPTSSCGFTNEQALTRAWALASAQLVWDARPDMSPAYLESIFNPLAKDLSCDFCKQHLQDRIRRLLDDWAAVKETEEVARIVKRCCLSVYVQYRLGNTFEPFTYAYLGMDIPEYDRKQRKFLQSLGNTLEPYAYAFLAWMLQRLD